MGYDDPTKDLRKAVKAKEKAAKKARKAKKKKTGKKEDLFDPENLAKFKAELEERKRREEEFAKEKVEHSEDSENSQKSPEAEGIKVEATDTEIKFTLDLENDPTDLIKNTNSVSATPNLKSPLTPVRNTDTDDWKLFQSLTSGVDAVIKQKKEELQEIKVDSYFQHKSQTPSGAVDPEEDHLDSDPGQDDKDKQEGADEKDPEDNSSSSSEDIGLVEIPEDDLPSEDEEDIFNTAFVDAITSGDVKLAVIPDDPVYDDDPFNTAYAEAIVQKDKVEKRKEANRIKFSG